MKKKTQSSKANRGRKPTRPDEGEVDFSKFRIKRNRYARRIASEGILLVHDSPSPSSLREMPEANFANVKARRTPYAKRVESGGIELQISRGRPPRGEEVGATVPKSIRLPPAVWALLEERARAEGVAVHALIRRAILDLLKGAA